MRVVRKSERARSRRRGGSGGELTQDRLQRLVLADHIHDARRRVFGGRLSGTGAVTPGYNVDQEPTMVTGARTLGSRRKAPLAGQKEASRTAGHHVHCHLRSAGCSALAWLNAAAAAAACRFAAAEEEAVRREEGEGERGSHVITLAPSDVGRPARKGRPSQRKHCAGVFPER